MGIYKFGFKILKTNIWQTILYLIAVIFSAAALFNAYNIMYDNKYISPQINTSGVGELLLLFLTFLLMFVVFFANSYFISSKSKEIAIGELNGVCSYKLIVMLSFQNLIIGITGGLLGIALGITSMPAFSAIMYKLLDITGSVYSFSKAGLGITILIITCIICPYVIIGDYSFVFNKEIKDLIDGQRKVYTPHSKKIEIPDVPENLKYLFPIEPKLKFVKPSKVTSIILYFVPVTILAAKSSFFYVLLFVYLCTTIIGIHSLLRYYFPDKILNIKSGKYGYDKIKLVSLSNLHYSLKKVNFLVITLSISLISLIYLIGMYKDSYQIKAMGIFAYVCAVLSLGTSILYKFIIEASYRKHIFKQLRIIGYNAKQIRKVIKEEILMLYGIAVIIPLFHILIYLFKFKSLGIITIQLAEMLLGIFIGIFIIIALVSYQVYRKLVM